MERGTLPASVMMLGAVLVTVLMLGSSVPLHGQARGPVTRAPGMFGEGLDLVAPTVMTAPDLGFRIESTKNGIAVGMLVVRINGNWVDAQVGSNGVMTTSAVR